MKRHLTAALLVALAPAAHAGEIASKYLCTDGTIIRLDTTGPRMTVEWDGNSFPVTEIDRNQQGVLIDAGIKNQTTAIVQPLWLDNPIQSSIFATFITSPNGDSVSVECNPDQSSKRLQF